MQIREGLSKQCQSFSSKLPIIFVSKGCVCKPRKNELALCIHVMVGAEQMTGDVHMCGGGSGASFKSNGLTVFWLYYNEV